LFCPEVTQRVERAFFSFLQNNCSVLPGGGRPHDRRKHEMLNKNFVPGLLAAVLALGVTGTGSVAVAAEKLAFAKEVDSCVAAVTSRLDLDRATRVRHLVSTAKQTGIGYVLTIETAVFFDSSEKKYEAYCVANGDNAPLKFRIEEIEI
jgi:hypothetical protein